MPSSDPPVDPPTPPVPEAAAKTSTRTEYVVLELGADAPKTGPWNEVARHDAGNADQAIKKHTGPAPDPKLAYVAVPIRSWQPVKPKTRTHTTTTLEPLT